MSTDVTEMPEVSSPAAHGSEFDDSNEFPYRAISRGAIVSVIFGFLTLPGLMFWVFLILAPIGILAALLAFRSVKLYPSEFSGASLAMFGLILNGTVLAGGIGIHTYIYYTEVPEGYTRVGFYELQIDTGMTEGPTSRAIEIDGQDVFIKGYIHPSSGGGLLRQFILVPDLGTCCFGGQPDSNDMIEVTLTRGLTTKAGLIKKKLAGKFMLNQAEFKVTDFDNGVFYQMRVDQIR